MLQCIILPLPNWPYFGNYLGELVIIVVVEEVFHNPLLRTLGTIMFWNSESIRFWKGYMVSLLCFMLNTQQCLKATAHNQFHGYFSSDIYEYSL